MEKYRAVMLVSPMGHDVNRICSIVSRWLKETGIFEVEIAGTYSKDCVSIDEYMTDRKKVFQTDLFFFLCSDEYWKNNKAAEGNLAEAVREGKGVLFYHGLHPCFEDNPEIEKMIGLLWRETANHGDFNYFDVSITDWAKDKKHPITEGVTPFRTKEELFCLLENPWNVPVEILVTAYSNPEVVSRWGLYGTGREEPVLTVGKYGKGNTVNFILGHVWEYYTGHGLMEDSTIAMEPPQFKTLLLRSCEWAVAGNVTATKNR
ncbi:ThuA domain-containing protein [Anaerocolumna sp. AGMB13025]|uniref:ThuA domain-containing protein n=1 Tax=Anaerocolumna sp. AGMB13025 TaxID=3039116 RepID=UPI0024200F98|nr:ThuA domain-containing protein [Anaerocolumna sp. AGMB13025]WFR57452.1 ThuA domain-containing protein [Anaerocolumna sp. AGMB13025]